MHRSDTHDDIGGFTLVRICQETAAAEGDAGDTCSVDLLVGDCQHGGRDIHRINRHAATGGLYGYTAGAASDIDQRL